MERRPFLRFFFAGVHYQWNVLPFGLNVSPRLFTKLFRTVAAYFRQRGVHCHVFIDDWLFFHEDEELLRRTIPLIVDTFNRLGVSINFQKSVLNPARQFEHLGIAFDLTNGMSFPSQATKENVLKLREALMNTTRWSPRNLMRWVGFLVTVMRHVPWGRAHVHEFVAFLNATFFIHPVTYTLPIDRRGLRRLLDTPVQLDPRLHAAAAWWTADRLSQGRPLGTPTFHFILGTDASLAGWGAHLTQGTQQWTASGHWPPHTDDHINVLEFRAVSLAVQLWLPRIAGTTVLLQTDNTTVMAYVNHLGGTRSRQMAQEAAPLAQLLEDNGIDLLASFVPGVDNVLADRLSRSQGPCPTEWKLAPRVARLLFQKWGWPTVDCFATAESTQLPVFCSLRNEDQSLMKDAFALPWEHQFLYLFPPTNPRLLLRVLTKLASSPGLRAILIAPRHPNAMYYSLIQQFSVTDPFPLPSYPDLLTQGPHQHPEPRGLHLHAFLLSVPS
jgi:hypothetical protein